MCPKKPVIDCGSFNLRAPEKSRGTAVVAVGRGSRGFKLSLITFQPSTYSNSSQFSTTNKDTYNVNLLRSGFSYCRVVQNHIQWFLPNRTYCCSQQLASQFAAYCTCANKHQSMYILNNRVILQAGAYDLFLLGFQSFRLWSGMM